MFYCTYSCETVRFSFFWFFNILTRKHWFSNTVPQKPRFKIYPGLTDFDSRVVNQFVFKPVRCSAVFPLWSLNRRDQREILPLRSIFGRRYKTTVLYVVRYCLHAYSRGDFHPRQVSRNKLYTIQGGFNEYCIDT